jgi:hypothetical protein
MVCIVQKGEFNGVRGILQSIQYAKTTTRWCGKKLVREGLCGEIQFSNRNVVLIPINEIDDGYAMTVNKAQGSEFRTVFVCITGRYMATCVNKRWLYTAVTRAKEMLYFITTHDIQLKTYTAVIQNSCPPLQHTTKIKELFHNMYEKIQPFQEDWTPEGQLLELHDDRLKNETINLTRFGNTMD